MQNLIQTLPKDEILRYLGYQGHTLTDAMDKLIDHCIAETLQTITPKYRYQAYSPKFTEEGVWLDHVLLEGNDIKDLLLGCDTVYLMAVTIGLATDRLIRQKMVVEPDVGVILDSCASTAVEALADFVEAEIQQAVALPLTMRYSPGYGDLPLTAQRDLVTVLDTHRKMGLALTESLLLTPSKSVTAILGVGTSKGRTTPKCALCKLKGSCAFRKRGTTC